eukprot:CAMPEP_0119400546 /NCGR_PEP_ID=MMETSP1334-20130426/141924_1 /TAXON_ID=127549 /ORGANISM="Calcidiscus leptoporus, Strain RCC1130" /LENGTH=545 /DNA_ID=CAMNT_0007424457 /DNA_START=1 /DNA_END=1638 /DNA_ORIENTATION=+
MHEAIARPGPLSLYYGASFKPASLTVRATRRPAALSPRTLRPSEVLTYKARLQARLANLYPTPPNGVDDPLEDVAGCTEAEIAARYIIPMLQSTDPKHTSKALALSFDELERMLASRDPSLEALVRAIRKLLSRLTESNRDVSKAQTMRLAESKAGMVSTDSAITPTGAADAGTTYDDDAAEVAVGEQRGMTSKPMIQISTRPTMTSVAGCSTRRGPKRNSLIELDGRPQLQEAMAALVLQTHVRGVLARKRLPQQMTEMGEVRRLRQAANQIQRHWSSHRIWEKPKWTFRRQHAALTIQRRVRCFTVALARRRLSQDSTLGEGELEEIISVRVKVLGFSKAAKLVLLPELLALHGRPIERLGQARTLWDLFSVTERVRAIASHLKRSGREERLQATRLGVCCLEGDELIELIKHIMSQSQIWGFTEEQLMQRFLEAQPTRLTMHGEQQLIASLIELLPASTAARTMERYALFSHFPPIRRHIPPVRENVYKPAHAPSGGVFGSPPDASGLQLTTTQVQRPTSNDFKAASPRAALPSASPMSKRS